MTLLGVHVTEVNLDNNHVQCYSNASVSQECLGLCQSDQVTYQALSSHPQCLSKYSQILKCAMSEAEVDSADMLKCCWDQGVSHHCDGWCHHLPEQVVDKENEEFCAISFSKQIIGCIDQQKQKKIGNTKTDNIIAPPNSKIEDIHTKDEKRNETSSPTAVVIDNNSLLQTANERTDRNVNIGVAVFCLVSIGGK